MLRNSMHPRLLAFSSTILSFANRFTRGFYPSPNSFLMASVCSPTFGASFGLFNMW